MAPKKTTKRTATNRKTVARTAPVMAPAPEMHECHCGTECRCHRGCTFCHIVKKIVVFAIIFALGFATAKLCCMGSHHGMHRGPRAHFVNGCLDTTDIKCPKMLEALPAMDINQDGCITREEYKIVKHEMRREVRENAPEVDED